MPKDIFGRFILFISILAEPRARCGSSLNAKSIPQEMSLSAFAVILTAACHYKIRMMLFWLLSHCVEGNLVDCTNH